MIVHGYDCVNLLHPAIASADTNRTAKLRFLWTVSVEQSATSPA